MGIVIMYTSLEYEACQYHPRLPNSHLYNIEDAPGAEKPDEDACDVVSRFQSRLSWQGSSTNGRCIEQALRHS